MTDDDGLGTDKHADCGPDPVKVHDSIIKLAWRDTWEACVDISADHSAQSHITGLVYWNPQNGHFLAY